MYNAKSFINFANVLFEHQNTDTIKLFVNGDESWKFDSTMNFSGWVSGSKLSKITELQNINISTTGGTATRLLGLDANNNVVLVSYP